MNSPHLAPDRDMMLSHLQLLFAGQTEGLVELAWTPANSNQVSSASLFSVDRLDDLVKRAVKLNSLKGINVYFGPGLRHPDTAPVGRAEDADFYLTRANWADADDPGVAEDVDSRSGRARPTFAVVTGRMPHERAQFYWAQEQPITDPEALKRQNAAIAAKLQTDSTVVNASRVMRLAGSIAWDKKPGRVAEMTELVTYNDRPGAYVGGEVAAGASARRTSACRWPPQSRQALAC